LQDPAYERLLKYHSSLQSQELWDSPDSVAPEMTQTETTNKIIADLIRRDDESSIATLDYNVPTLEESKMGVAEITNDTLIVLLESQLHGEPEKAVISDSDTSEGSVPPYMALKTAVRQTCFVVILCYL